MAGRNHASTSHIHWNRSWINSLTRVVPDVVLETEDETFIFDAKYKSFLEDVDDWPWRDTQEILKEEHRNDFHQVVSYASLYGSKRLTSFLVYPMRYETWKLLSLDQKNFAFGVLDGPSRQVNIGIVGIPIELGQEHILSDIWKAFESCRDKSKAN